MANDIAPAATPAGASGSTEKEELKRAIGPALLLLFIMGDVLGTGVYALTGKVAKEVGGAVWLPFLCAFLVAMITACSYLELVTKYPRAGGAATYTHRAFNVHFLTFLVAFTVMASGLTSSSSAAKAFAANFARAVGWKSDQSFMVVGALFFLTVIALVNLRGVSESVKLNVVLTLVEMSGLTLIVGVGLYALLSGKGDTSHLMDISFPQGESAFSAVTAATALAFFAMVGFEDSVNMAEETKDPARTFPKIMLIALSLAGCVYLLVAISAVSLVPAEKLSQGSTPLIQVLEAGWPGFPVGVFAVVTMFAVANTALLNMLMASRLVYGMSRERVLPHMLGKVLPVRRTPWVAIVFTTLLAFALVAWADLEDLGGTTAFLLLVVFTIVNIAVLVLRRDQVSHSHFRTPTLLPVLGGLFSAFLASPFSGRNPRDFAIGGVLLVVGILLWFVTFLVNKKLYGTGTPSPDFAEAIEKSDD
ncbi:amino acid/polyamine/organocation transporter, APC superfamily [Austwickia chelonae]|nr:APC family permease [Austwickia chelonae]SEW42274.1 amino acid/polyamine/organocation transporter, APC superfamily [Austwickia chelonae]